MASGLAGKWEADKEQTEGFDEFMLANGFDKETIETIRKSPVVEENVQNGDTWTMVSKAGDYNNTVTWQFGKPYETVDMLGNPATITPRIDGDSIVKDIVSKTPTGDDTFVLKITITGDSMKRVITDSKGRTMIQIWTRMK